MNRGSGLLRGPLPVSGVPPIEDRYWFDDLADFLGPAYLPNAFSGGGGAPTTTTESCAAAIAAATKTAPSVPAGAVLKESGTNGGGCFNR